MHPAVPNPALAREIASAYGRRAVAWVRRFPTGLCHYVYDLRLRDGGKLVVRIARPGNEKLLQSAVYWQGRLRAAGVPAARILHADLEKRKFPFGYLILERLAGTDLGDAYPRLSLRSKRQLGSQIADLQQATAKLPPASRFGEALSYEVPGPHSSWNAFVVAQIESCGARVHDGSALRREDSVRLARSASSLAPAFSAVKALPFLDDITTKNVIVTPEGGLSGIVDLDTVFFGDSLFSLALTRAAFTKLGYDSVYTDAWRDALQLGDRSRAFRRSALERARASV